MMKTLVPLPLMLAACSGHALADATLNYEITGPGGTTTKTIAVSHFFARIEDAANKETWLLYQAGKFFPLYEVNPAAGTYTRLTPDVRATLGPDSRSAGTAKAEAEPTPQQQPAARDNTAEDNGEGGETPPSEAAAAAPAAQENAESALAPAPAGGDKPEAEPDEAARKPLPAKPEFRATRETREVAGIECRVVEEIRDGYPVVAHCMANKARLGVTEREIRTVARTFVMARERNLGWLGAGTEDEAFVSIQARDLESGRKLVLQSVSTAPLPRGHLRIPREYRQTNP
jgi:hypothetical protein